MKQAFQQSMTWLHTLSTLLLIWILFAIFFAGTLAFFRVEITHWMQPESHASAPSEKSLQVALDYLTEHAPNAKSWQISLPDSRTRTTGLSWENYNEERQRRRGPREIINADSGEPIKSRETAGGGFLYRFHFELYHIPRGIARLLVGIATMMMFVGIITGLFTRRKLFAHFFTYRPGKNLLSWIDAHVVTGLMALPFHIMITFSGLILFSNILLFLNTDDNRGRFDRGRDNALAAKEIAPPTVDNWQPKISAMIAHAQQQWSQEVSNIRIDNPRQSDARFSVESGTQDSLTAGRNGHASMSFNYDGQPIEHHAAEKADNVISATYSSLRQLHEAHFADTTMRWLFFFCGVLGTFMVASGAILWVIKRARQQLGKFGVELVSALNVGGIAGLICATGSLFWANRFLPVGIVERRDWEINVFFIIWGICLLYAVFFRHRKGWSALLALASVLYISIPLLDQFTSPVSLLHAFKIGDWIRLGFDGVALLFGLGMFTAFYYLALRNENDGLRLANLKSFASNKHKEETC
ncbi:PepSY-associated TM helix domain-containing protein [Gilvimarinus chinensis]|uniref:PepSY-associated TM helix domain-containing protein n=1 Tax=Gilvimarinus chinensis TaxID=396005 RepID=UPI0003635612|nr:PepSY-associated TM helix domain-containing protein [Gilvimarinus chinensis]